MRDKLDDMKECLDQKTYEVKDLEKQLDDMKKKMNDDVTQYTTMVNDYGDKMTDLQTQLTKVKKEKQEMEYNTTMMMDKYGKKMAELEEKYKQSTLEVTKITAEVVRVRNQNENFTRYNGELQQKLNEAKAPSNIYFCRHGEVYHGPSCAHTKDKQVNFLRKCKDCLP